MDLKEVEMYVDTVIPKLERELVEETGKKKLLELYNLYEDILILVAPYDFISYNKALEFHEDKTDLTKGFYHHRKNHIGDIFQAMNDMEIYNKYDMLLVSMPPRVGKSTTNIRFQTWICGRYPEQTQLATSYSSAVTNSFYAGFMEIVTSEQYNKIFPQSPLMNQNAKRNEVWLKTIKRYPSIAFISIGASMTGVGEASKYLFCDDLISGIEEALSITRMEKLWQLYTVNARQRKKDGAKEIHISTRWTVNGVITKLSEEHKNDPRCKIINVPALDKNGESNFNFKGGFSTKYYENMKDTMDEMSFNALYMGDPIEREGLLYSEDELQYFYDLPSDNPDTVVSVCDSKALGKDNVASPVGHIYGDTVYIEDVIYDDGLPEITVPRVAGLWYNQKVVRGDVEMNAGGNFFADRINEEIKELGGHTSIRMFFTSQNKRTKIITYSDYIKKHFVFKHPSQYSPNSDYARFMNDLFRWTQKGSSNQVDDAPDSLAMLAQLVQELDDNIIKIMDRQQLRL